MLEAKGSSMTSAGIEEGDLLVVEENPSPPNGSVVAALILDKEEATVKVLRREGEKVRLKPRNGAYEDIVVPVDRVAVHGTVEWVIRACGAEGRKGCKEEEWSKEGTNPKPHASRRGLRTLPPQERRQHSDARHGAVSRCYHRR